MMIPLPQKFHNTDLLMQTQRKQVRSKLNKQ